jgi:ketosteroid isomerase-like protein
VPVSEANVATLQQILEQLFGSRRIDPALLAEDVEWVNPREAVESAHAQLWSFSDGRATRMEWFNTHQEAREAAGVRE